jgi:hypothetical protein
MREQDWLTSADPEAMLDYVRGQTTDRKLRLFACACCRDVWHLLPDARSRAAVEVSERYADGLAGPKEQARARGAAVSPTGAVAWAAYWAVSNKLATCVVNVSHITVEARARAAEAQARAGGADQAADRIAAWEGASHAALREQACLLRDIRGNPFRCVAADPAWLAWRGGLVVAMARQLYEARDFGDLAILADALEDAGCTDAELLGHCRSGGRHVRGCWALDLLLGKE